MNIYIDIETIPSQDPAVKAEILAAVKPPAQYKKPESIAEWMRENAAAEAEQQWLRTALDGTLGRIACIAWAVGDGQVQLAGMYADGQPGLVEEDIQLDLFFSALREANLKHNRGGDGPPPTLVGHNLNQFDLPFLLKRAVITRTEPPHWFPVNPKPWDDATFDTMTYWAGHKGYVTLDKLCRALAIPGKTEGIDGSQVWPMVQAGRLAEVIEYCKADVEAVRRVHKRLTFAG